MNGCPRIMDYDFMAARCANTNKFVENCTCSEIHDYTLFYDRDIKRWVVTFRDKDGNCVEAEIFSNKVRAGEYGLRKTGKRYIQERG